MAFLNGSENAPMFITSLHYFHNLVEEVSDISIGEDYWKHMQKQSEPTGKDVERSKSKRRNEGNEIILILRNIQALACWACLQSFLHLGRIQPANWGILNRR